MSQVKTEENTHKKRAKEQIRKLGNIIVAMAVALAALTLTCVFLGMKVSELEGSKVATSDDYSQKYNELLIENQNLKEQLSDSVSVSDDSDLSDSDNLQRITELEETIENNGKLMEEIYADGEDPALLSEAYYYAKTKWNLLENYDLSDSGSSVSSGFIRVNPRYYYCAYAPAGNFTITSYSEDFAQLETVKDDASTGLYVKFDDKAYYIKVSFSSESKNKAIFVSTGIDKETMSEPLSRRAFYVVSKNSPVSLSPSLAVSKVISGGTVLVLPGTYNDTISASSKAINLLGVGSGRCIIQSSSSDYYTPPLEIAAGTVSNISFKAVNSGAANTELKAYGVHVDYDYSYGRNLTISNCVITSDFNAGIGIGLRGNGTLKLVGCTISGADRGIFLHDCDRENFGGNQNLVIDSCDITSIGSSPAVHLHSQGMSNANVSLTFTNNVLKSTGGNELLVCTNQNGGTFEDSWNSLQNYHLVNGYGNNVAVMNQ